MSGWVGGWVVQCPSAAAVSFNCTALTDRQRTTNLTGYEEVLCELAMQSG